MQRTYFLSCLVIFTFFIGCSSSPTSPSSNNNNNNNSTDSASYLPLSTGSSWTYSGSAGTYTVTILGDTTFGGYNWKVISNSAAAGRGYIRKDGAIYRQTSAPGFILSGEVIALNETPGSTWAWDINSSGSINHYQYTNSAQGLTRTVLGKQYSNVIDVQMDYTFTFNGFPPVTGTYHYYYARGIGLIDSDLGAQGDQPIVSYSIK